ncbi:MAG: glycosyltransferase [Luteitalea sp.]|nr:glycosyltransferase [Luteitalea sp.]
MTLLGAAAGERGSSKLLDRGLSSPNACDGRLARRSAEREGGPRVSVVVLNHNYGCYLKQCLDSVLAQDYEPLEVIVVDDGSTDDSRAVIESYDGRVISAFKPNGGVASTMNRGFALSHGSVVIFVDADDFLLPGAVADHVRAHRDPEVVRSQAYLTILKEAPYPLDTIPGEPPGEGDLCDLVLARGPGAFISAPQSGNAWARRYLEQVIPLPETLKGIGADSLLMDTAPLFGKIVALKTGPRAVYRVHNNGMNAAKAGLTPAQIRKTVARQEARACRLEEVATSLGHAVDRSEWKSRSWRLLTLDYLAGRLGDEGMIVPLTTHLRPVWRVRGNALKRLFLAAALLCIRIAPTRLSLVLTGRIINPRYL